MDVIFDFFKNNLVAGIILDAYLALFMIAFCLFFAMRYKKAFNLLIGGILIFLFKLISDRCGLVISSQIYNSVFSAYIVICFIIIAPEIRKVMDYSKKADVRSDMVLTSTQSSKEAIADAVFNMSNQKVGALITIEQHSSLDQYAERAITLNSEISRELLEQIFIKDSPLHDGGVIIRGNKIVCAAAYYNLTQDFTLDKTVGSRHRAAIGISEVTDAITIVVSEETGQVHLTHTAFMKLIESKTELLEYLSLYLGN